MNQLIIKQRIAQIDKAWNLLQLETMEKAQLTRDNLVTLARLSVDYFDKAARDAMPLGLAEYRPEVVDQIMAFAHRPISEKDMDVRLVEETRSGVVKKYSLGNFARGENSIQPIAETILGDFKNISLALFSSLENKDHWLNICAGNASKPRARELHVDTLPRPMWLLHSRIGGLPALCCRGDVMKTASPSQLALIKAAEMDRNEIYSEEAVSELQRQGLLQEMALNKVCMLAARYQIDTPAGTTIAPGTKHASSARPIGGAYSAMIGYCVG